MLKTLLFCSRQSFDLPTCARRQVEKTVLVPTPRLRHGLFNRLVPPSLAKEELRRVARAEGVSKFSTPVGLENIIPVDLIVVGSVAVSKDGEN